MTGSRTGRRLARFAAGAVSVIVLAACSGAATPASGVSATSATLNATASCDANSSGNPCLAWFQWWADGSSPTVQSSRATPIGPVSSPASNVAISQSVSGLAPGTLYHYQLCGQGDQNVTSPICVGTSGSGGANAPGTAPAALDATGNFRTANPGANPPTQATVDYGRVTSSGETANGVLYGRDGGTSVQFSTNPARSLWVFGDTPIIKSGSSVGFVAGTTAAIATNVPGQPSVSLAEVQSPLSSSSSFGATRFLGDPLSMPNCTVANLNAEFPSDNDTSAWPNRYDYTVTKEPGSSRVVMVFADVCLGFNAAGLTRWINEALGFAEYDPVSNVFTRAPTVISGTGYDSRSTALPTSLPLRQVFNNAVFFSDGVLYLFSATGGYPASTPASEYLARIDPAHLTSGSAYQWCAVLSGGSCATWSSDPNAAVSVATPNYFGWSETTLADFSAQPGICSATATVCYVMLSQAFGGFQILSSETPWGPWTSGPAGQVPDSCSPGALGCYAVVAKPELSTSSQLVMSWFSSDDVAGGGHVRLVAMPWTTPLRTG